MKDIFQDFYMTESIKQPWKLAKSPTESTIVDHQVQTAALVIIAEDFMGKTRTS